MRASTCTLCYPIKKYLQTAEFNLLQTREENYSRYNQKKVNIKLPYKHPRKMHLYLILEF